MLKATGTIRRIDDLGRIVIPKEIRRNLKIREGDSLEIFVDTEGCVTFKPLHEYCSYCHDEIVTNEVEHSNLCSSCFGILQDMKPQTKYHY